MIPNTQTSFLYPSNGIALGYNYPNKIFAATDLQLTAFDLTGIPYLFSYVSGVIFSQPSLGITATITNIDVDVGAIITLSGPLINGWTFDIRSVVAETQLTSIKNQGSFLPDLHEEGLDKLTRTTQDLNRRTYVFGIHGPDNESVAWPMLPGATTRANTGLVFDGNGLPTVGFIPTNAVTQPLFNALMAGTPALSATSAEAAAVGLVIVNGTYAVGNILRYGIVPNNPAAATNNTSIAKALWNPAFPTGPQGQFYFPNTTGADIYYFNGVIPMRYDCYIDGGGCTVNYTAAVGVGDANSGLFLFLSDGGIQNMKFAVACDTTAATGAGHAVFMGGRDVGTYFTVFDSLLPRSLGRLVMRNLVVNVNNTGTHVSSSGGIEMLGGLRDVLIENVSINLNSTCPYGIIAEFGWATSEPLTANRQTSHAHNMIFRNIDVSNCGNQDGGSGSGIALGGAYNCLIDGLYVNTAPTAFTYYVGEALFFRPWVGVDDIGAKHGITLRNIVGDSLSGTGLSLGGSSLASGGYLAATIAALGHPADYIAQTDLMTFSLDGFVIQAAGVGMNVTGSIDARNGTLNGAAASGQLVVDDECTFGVFTNCKFLNGSGTGVRMSLAGPIWSPARLKQLIFDNCVVAGNTTNGYILSNSRSVHIRGGRIGYSTAYDGVNETTQTNCINVAGASGGAGAMLDSVYCTPGTAGTVYVATGTTAGNDVKNPKGTITFSGNWNINGLAQASSASIAAAANVVNTVDKYAGKLAYDTSNKRMLVAQGPNATDQWELCDGTVAITPA